MRNSDLIVGLGNASVAALVWHASNAAFHIKPRYFFIKTEREGMGRWGIVYKHPACLILA